MHSIAWNARVRELSRMSKSQLAHIWRLGAGRNCVWTAHPVETWNKDELINDILRAEFPDGGEAEGELITDPAEIEQIKTWSFGRLAGYPEGPWSSEPDKVQWVDEATGLDCLIFRNRVGALCGYVGVPQSHPWHGVGYSVCVEKCAEDWCYDHSPAGRVEVHGGLTYADACMEGAGDDAICHVPFDGRPANVWWFGFDTAHAGDLSPYDAKRAEDEQNRYPWAIDATDRYRDVGYVKRECGSLAEQLASVSS